MVCWFDLCVLCWWVWVCLNVVVLLGVSGV